MPRSPALFFSRFFQLAVCPLWQYTYRFFFFSFFLPFFVLERRFRFPVVWCSPQRGLLLCRSLLLTDRAVFFFFAFGLLCWGCWGSLIFAIIAVFFFFSKTVGVPCYHHTGNTPRGMPVYIAACLKIIFFPEEANTGPWAQPVRSSPSTWRKGTSGFGNRSTRSTLDIESTQKCPPPQPALFVFFDLLATPFFSLHKRVFVLGDLTGCFPLIIV